MENFDRKKHWDNIYQSKELDELSWYQAKPETSLDFLKQFNIPRTAKIIDIGGGDSFFVDHLLELGYQNITVLDISETALNRAKKRLGKLADKVKWIVTDITKFRPTEKYDFWHDRAAFHFLIDEEEIKNYIDIVQQTLKPNGILVLATFSKQGPEKCSGIQIRQYSETGMNQILSKFFDKIKCTAVEHKTPFDKIQSFIFCSFRKLNND